MSLKAVLFDLDGVIVDTAKFHHESWVMLANEHGIDFPEEFFYTFKGLARSECVKLLFKDESDENKLQEYAAKKNEYYNVMLKTLKPEDIFEGVKDLLLTLKDNNIKIGICSASKNTMTVLEKLEIKELFDCIIDGTQVENPKPDPEVFLKGAFALSVKNNECIVVEDAEVGVEAAKRAGMLAVGIGNKEKLKQADLILEHTKELSYTMLMDLYKSSM
ncbi:MAG: Beta-phosphoglucomutase [Firmicutes bacterium ADurb.Bin193]|nr:MAG: Beta-phosphoglucomutase [Firmicutes bacterium ADurb.Bin193]